MVTTSASSIQEIARLLDIGNIVYINKETGKIVSVPEFDDFADFNDNSDQEMEDVELNPDLYHNIRALNSRELYNNMMDFAQELEERSTTIHLVEALRKSNGINHFNDCMRKLCAEHKQAWQSYINEKLKFHIKHQLKKLR